MSCTEDIINVDIPICPTGDKLVHRFIIQVAQASKDYIRKHFFFIACYRPIPNCFESVVLYDLGEAAMLGR